MKGTDNMLREKTRAFIRDLADVCQWEPTQLARAAELAPSTINRFLNDDAAKHVLSTKTMAKIIDAVVRRLGDLEDEDPAGIDGRAAKWSRLTSANRALIPHTPEPGGERPPSGMLMVRETRISAASGGGTVIEGEKDGELWGFPAEWARVELRAAPSELRIITIVGDSMACQDDPLCLYSGDKVIVNTAMRDPSPPGAFVIFDGIGLVAKRAEIVANSDPARVRISSANKAYQPYERTLEEAHIVGRIVGTWRRL